MDQNTTQVYVVSLPDDADRREAIRNQLGSLSGFRHKFADGVFGKSLSDLVCYRLVDHSGWVKHKGAIGCFLAHVNVWEDMINNDLADAIVLEDDADASQLQEFKSLQIPDDADIVFINDRMCESRADRPVLVSEISNSLRKLDQVKGGAGTDGYYLRRSGAIKLLKACETDLFFGHIDGRLLRYVSTEADLETLGGTWIAEIVQTHHHPTRKPQLGLLKGYSCTSPLVKHIGVVSRRDEQDSGNTVLTA